MTWMHTCTHQYAHKFWLTQVFTHTYQHTLCWLVSFKPFIKVTAASACLLALITKNTHTHTHTYTHTNLSSLAGLLGWQPICHWLMNCLISFLCFVVEASLNTVLRYWRQGCRDEDAKTCRWSLVHSNSRQGDIAFILFTVWRQILSFHQHSFISYRTFNSDDYYPYCRCILLAWCWSHRQDWKNPRPAG